MPTFTLSGFQISRDTSDDVIEVNAVSLVLIIPAGQTSFSYSVEEAATAQDLPVVDITAAVASATLSGPGVPGGPVPLPNDDITRLGTIATTGGTSHDILEFEFRDEDGSSETVVFQIGGDPLTLPTTPAQLQTLNESIQVGGLTAASGALAEGATIDFSSLTSVSVDPSPASVIAGTDGNDNLVGTVGDDYIGTGDTTPDGDFVEGSTGDDTIDASGMNQSTAFLTLGYGALGGPVTVTIDSATNTFDVDKGALGTDTLIGIANPLTAGGNEGGLGVIGTASDDVFNLAPGADQWMQARAGDGTDSFTIGTEGFVRLDFAFTGSPGGIDVDLGTGTIADDGFGNAETIDGPGDVWEVRGTDLADDITGSMSNESFILRGGDDTLDGGGGFDRLRYDRSGVGQIIADLGAGTVTGTWDGNGFTHSVSGIAQLRGSNNGDSLAGDTNDNRLEGRDGNDTIGGGLGDDFVSLGTGQDTYVYSGGNDIITDFDVANDSILIDIPGVTQQDIEDAFANSFFFADPGGVGDRQLVGFISGESLGFVGLSAADVANINVTVGDGGLPTASSTIGTDGDDFLEGTPGDDLITTGDATPNGDAVVGSAGDDIIDMTGMNPNTAFMGLGYSGLGSGIDVTINGATNTGTVDKGALGTDTLLGVENPMFAGWTVGGLGLDGTGFDDTFNVTLDDLQWMSIRGGAGQDTYTINTSVGQRLDPNDDVGALRLDMRFGDGIDVNLATGEIADDGYGNIEQINGNAPIWEVWGSGGDDTFVGSDNAESYRYTGGNNNLDGGLGFDRLRYDSAGVASVVIDAAGGVVTGTFDGGGTFTDTISGFERLRGSSGDDTIIGEAGVDNRYEGRGGADRFDHLGGNDMIGDFNAGEDILLVRLAGLDQAAVDAAMAAATDAPGDVSGSFSQGAQVDFGGSTVTFAGLTVADLAGADVQFVRPGSGNLVLGTDGSDDLVGTAGDDLITTGDNAGGDTGFDFVSGSTGDDTIDMSGITDGYVGIGYGGFDRIDVVINGGGNTGTVTKFAAGGAAGTDTLVEVDNPLFSGWSIGGLSIRGTVGDDTFDVTPEGEQWMSLSGGAGVDSFSINGTGLVRLDFREVNQAIDINLANGSGQIVNDGFGNTETITGTSLVWDIQGSGFDDTVTGSFRDESYTALGGNNTLDGGGGFDRLRYDRDTIASVTIDATAGTATGTLAGGGTFTDTIAGFEHLRGSDGDDQITGEALVDNLYEGQEGTDTFVHLGGNDTIADFDVATETLIVRMAGLDQAAVDAAIANATDVPASTFASLNVFPELEGGALVDFGDGNTVSFGNLSAADLAGADVQFVTPGSGNLVLGTDDNDTLTGTAGDDLITTGDNPSFDLVQGSGGNDEIDFTGITSDPGGFVVVDYSGIVSTIDVQVDGGANTGSVAKGGLGTDTFTNVELPLLSGWTTGGLSIIGTSGADTFDVSPEGEQWMSIQPGDGVDTIIVNGNGTERVEGADPIGAVRLDMSDGTQGIDVNLATRTIADDGFGNAETIGGTAPVWEVRGTAGNDTFVGSDNAESYRYTGGNNDLDGGLGFDRLRYDSFIESVSINAATGVATGVFFGGGTFTDTISGFEHFRGTQGNDSFIGTDENERFEGGQGNDTIIAGGGDDTLAGGEGDATLNGGSGSDIFFVGNGRTVIEDFNAAEDALDFSFTGLGLVGRNTALANATDNGGETTVDLGNGGNLIFSSLSVADVQALADPDAGTPPPPPTTPIAWTVGDPHLLTLDGVGYDFHAIGEYVLLRGTSEGSFSDFEIQSRMGPVLDDLGDPVPNVSANIAIAARLGNGEEVMIDSADDSPLSIGGVVTTIADGDAIEVGNDLIARDGDMYTVIFAGADGTVGNGDARLNVIVREAFVDLSVQISADMAGAVEGLLGDGNGNPDDDIARADGTVLERPLAFDDLYGEFRDDWRVTTEEQSLFTYDAGETLEGFYDPDAPGDILSVDDFDDIAVGAARTAVEGAGLTPGTVAYENALIDFLLTGDETFIESSSDQTAPTPENTGSAGTLNPGEDRLTLNVSLIDESGAGIDGAVVNFTAGGAPILGQAAGTPGAYNLRLGSLTGEGRVDAVRDFDTGDASIDVTDALNALRLAVGLNPSFGPANAMDFIAADVDQSGAVNVTDALDILRFAVGLETENAPRWVFLDDTQDLSGTSNSNVSYETGTESGAIIEGGDLQLTGVLLGNLAEV